MPYCLVTCSYLDLHCLETQTQCTLVTQADTDKRDVTEDDSGEPIHVSEQAEESGRPDPGNTLQTRTERSTLASLPEPTNKDSGVKDRTLIKDFEEQLSE